MIYFWCGFIHSIIQSFLFPYFHLWLSANIVVQDTRQIYLWRWRNRPRTDFWGFDRSVVIHFLEHNIHSRIAQTGRVSSLFIFGLWSVLSSIRSSVLSSVCLFVCLFVCLSVCLSVITGIFEGIFETTCPRDMKFYMLIEFSIVNSTEKMKMVDTQKLDI